MDSVKTKFNEKLIDAIETAWRTQCLSYDKMKVDRNKILD